MDGARGLRFLWLATVVAMGSGCAARLAESDGAGTDVASMTAASSVLHEAEPASEPSAGDETASDPIAPMDPGSRTVRTVGWVGISVGAEAAVVAIGTSAMLLHEKQVRDENCNARRVCTSQGYDANGSIATLAGWNAGAWILSAAGFAAGGVLLAISWKDAQRTTAITVVPTGSGVGVGVRRSF